MNRSVLQSGGGGSLYLDEHGTQRRVLDYKSIAK